MDTHSGWDCAVRVGCMQSGRWVYYRNIINEYQLIYCESLQRLNCSGKYCILCGVVGWVCPECGIGYWGWSGTTIAIAATTTIANTITIAIVIAVDNTIATAIAIASTTASTIAITATITTATAIAIAIVTVNARVSRPHRLLPM